MTVFEDLKSKRLIVLKGVLFLVLGLLSAALLLWERPEWRVALLLGVCVWAFCRFYFFAFYVIERWVDPGYRFTGLWDFARWMLSKRPSETKG
ncbi:MAG: hypothetical protein QM765_07645 [Myxococcales bacterium]